MPVGGKKRLKDDFMGRGVPEEVLRRCFFFILMMSRWKMSRGCFYEDGQASQKSSSVIPPTFREDDEDKVLLLKMHQKLPMFEMVTIMHQKPPLKRQPYGGRGQYQVQGKRWRPRGIQPTLAGNQPNEQRCGE